MSYPYETQTYPGSTEGTRASAVITTTPWHGNISTTTTDQTAPTYHWHARQAQRLREQLGGRKIIRAEYLPPRTRGGESMSRIKRIAVWMMVLAIVLCEVVRDARNY